MRFRLLLLSMSAAAVTNLLELFFAASQQIDVVSKSQVAKRSSSNGHWRQWVVHFFSSSAALCTKQLFSDGCWGVIVFGIVFSRNILNSTGDNGHPCHTPTVVQKQSPTFPFSFSTTTALCRFIILTSLWHQSAGCGWCILLRLAGGHHAMPDTIKRFCLWMIGALLVRTKWFNRLGQECVLSSCGTINL